MWIVSGLVHFFLACNLLWSCSLVETSNTELRSLKVLCLNSRVSHWSGEKQRRWETRRGARTPLSCFLTNSLRAVWHYLDDFWTCGPPAPDPCCHRNLQIMLKTCLDLGFTTNSAKTTQPTTTLKLLGIELDSIKQEARISQVWCGVLGPRLSTPWLIDWGLIRSARYVANKEMVSSGAGRAVR